MSNVDPKALFRDKENFGEFVDSFGFGVGHVFFMTVTFKSNSDKLKCADAFNVFRTYLNKKSIRYSHGLTLEKFHYISVWEEHKNGGWHLHLIGHIQGASTSRLRAVVRSFLRSTSTVLGFIQVKWTRGHDGNGIKYYIFKYLSKGNRKKGIRYVNYSRNWVRKVKLPFSWLGGKAGQWRNACKEIYNNFPNSFRVFYNNCSHRSRLDVVLNWVNGEYDYAISALKRYNFGVFTDAFRLDVKNLIRYMDQTNSLVFSDEDKAVKSYFDYASFSDKSTFTNGYHIEDCEVGSWAI